MTRFLLVHAHPDDELLATGVALARLPRLGHEVHVLTCTLGEEGEVIPPELAHLEGSEQLAAHRRGELSVAMAHLNLEATGGGHRVLGELDETTPDPQSVRWRDSGMAGSPASRHPRAWVGSDGNEAVGAVRTVIEELRPDVVITYDPRGGYDHPDHIRTHRVTCEVVAALPARGRPVLLAQVTPFTWAQDDRAWVLGKVNDPRLHRLTDEPYPACVVHDAQVTHEIHGDPADLALRDRALAEHATQVTVYDGYYALSNDIAARLPVREGYAALDPLTGDLLPVSDDRIASGLRTALETLEGESR